jgi:hypothetical protein
MITFRKQYFILALSLFLIEVLIALFLHDRIIRPYVGDFLVVILIYCFIRSFINAPVLPTAVGVLIFAYAIESLQYVDLIGRLGLRDSRIANVVLGNYFEWTDIVAYTLGIVTVLLVENLRSRTKEAPQTNNPAGGPTAPGSGRSLVKDSPVKHKKF